MATNGIDFVIGGKDQAKPAMASVEKSLSRLEDGTNRLQHATKGLIAAMGPLVAVFAAFKTAVKIGDTITAANEAYDKQIGAVEGLEVALRLQGDASDETSKSLQAFASDMQRLTGVGDETTLSLMRQASMLGVQTEQLDDASKAAIGLSEATGKSLDESLKLVKNSLEGEFGAFGEIIPAIKTMATEEEKLAAVLALSQKGLEAKAEASQSVAGMSERASGAVGDLLESVGALLAPVRILISTGIKTLAEALQQVLTPAVEYAEQVLANIGPVMDWVVAKVTAGVNLIVGAFTFFEVIVTNLGDVWELVKAQAERYMLAIAGTISHTFTEVIPAYASWFGKNFFNLMKDAFNLAYTVIANSVTKIIDTLSALWDWIASAGTTDILGQLGEIGGRSYLEGFESSLTALPHVAERAISAREQELADTVGRIGGALGDEFRRKMSERMISVQGGFGEDVSREIDLQLQRAAMATTGSQAVSSGGGGSAQAQLTTGESRLLTRGNVDKSEQLWQQMVRQLDDISEATKTTADAANTSNENLADIRGNTANSTQLVPVT